MGELLALALGLFLFTSPFLWWSNRNQRIELEKKFQKLKDNAASYDEMLDLRDQLNQQKASVDRERQQRNSTD
jgi:dsDNA-binding SOS-regulon protein